MIVSTECLGRPGSGSSWFERLGFVQRQLVYPNDPHLPTATCHLQRCEGEPALCGYQCEGLVAVPCGMRWVDIDSALRCDACDEAASSVDERW